MQGIQAFAIAVTLVEAALLLIVFLTTARSTDSFISVELKNISSFRLLLTMFVVATTLLSLVYVYTRDPLSPWVATASMFAVCAVACWSVLSVTETDTPEHTTATGLYLLSSALLTFIQLFHASRRPVAFVAVFAVISACGALFLVLNLTGNRASAALFEWFSAFTTTALLCAFYALNPFGVTKRPVVESLVPLLPTESGRI